MKLGTNYWWLSWKNTRTRGTKRITIGKTAIIKWDITENASPTSRINLAQIQILFDIKTTFYSGLLIQLRSFDLVEPLVIFWEERLHMLVLTLV